MMKRKFLAVILPLVGCATLVGSGFSAWYFGAAVETSALNTFLNIDVTAEAKNPTLTLTTNIDTDLTGKYLVLDQGVAGNDCVYSGITVSDSESNNDVTKITNDKKLKIKLQLTRTDDGSTYVTLKDIYDAGYRVVIQVDIDFKGALNKYVTIQDDLALGLGDSTGEAAEGTDTKFKKLDTPNTNASETYRAFYYVAEPETADGEPTSWEISLDMSTKSNLHSVEDVEHIDYRSSFLRYIQSDGTEGDQPGKPNASGEPYAMEQALTNSDAALSINVSARIEEANNLGA